MSDGYEIVGYEPALKAGIVALQRHLWSPDIELNRAYFEWKHERNPYLPSPVASVVLHGDEVVGMRSLTGSTWEVGRDRPAVVLPYADDFVIAPEHRQTGLAARIMASVNDLAATLGAPYLVSLSAGETTALQSYASGWRSAGAMLPIKRAREPGIVAHVARVASRLGIRVDPFARLDRHSGPVAVEETPRPDAMARLVESLGYDGRIRHCRDAAFFAWRFLNPLHEYRFLFLGDDPLGGYLVVQRKVAASSGRRVQIVDWEATDLDALARLLDAAIATRGLGEIVAWEAAQPPGGLDLLWRAGFEPADLATRRRGYPAVLVREADASPGEWTLGGHRVLDPASWDVRLLYSMHG